LLYCSRTLEHGVRFVCGIVGYAKGVLDLIESWQARFGRGNSVIWNVISRYLRWCLWCERNAM